MSHPLIASFGVACLIGAVPLAASAAEDTALLAADPLQTTNMAQEGFKMLRTKIDQAPSGARMTPVIYGPDFIPKSQMNGVSPDSGASKLEGHQFKFR